VGTDWSAALRTLLAAAVEEHGHAAVAAETARVLDALAGGASAAVPVEVPCPVLGVDACAGGWVGVLLRPGGAVSVHLGATIATLVGQVRDTVDLRVMALDIPIGLPDTGVRQADVLARRALPGKASSVFTTLTRAAYEATTYAEARAVNVRATGGQSASAQAWALRAKILEVDRWLRGRSGRDPVEVLEVHPELSFARMAGRPLTSRKKDDVGVRERRAVLRAAGIDAPAWFRGSGFAEDDLLDACAAAWSAARHARGEAESLPAEPEVFGDGIPAAIRV
jgi:predicted RNase H-like nuclease